MSNLCSECGSTNAAYNSSVGEVYCKDCGLVLDDFEIEREPYLPDCVRSLAMQPSISKAGGLPQNGKIIQRSWLESAKEKSFELAKIKLNLVASKLKLTPLVITETSIIFKNALDRDLTIGRESISLLYGSIYAACLIHKVPRTPLEITAFSEVTKKSMLKSFKLLKRELSISTSVLNPIDLIPRFASKLNLDPQVTTKAIEIASKSLSSYLMEGKNPQTIAACAIYLAGNHTDCKITQRSIANITGVLEVTIRKRSKEITNLV